MKRRDFLKHSLQLSSLSLLQGHIPLQFLVKNFQVFWLHIEGAPVRETFDFWADPKNQFDTQTLAAGNRLLKLKRAKYFLPNIWHDFPNSSWTLDHWLTMRGIALKGPHLKQSRREWFRQNDDLEKSIFQKFNESFAKEGLSQADLVSTGEETANIYRPLLKEEIKNLNLENPNESLKNIFSHWKKLAAYKNISNRSPLSMAVTRGPQGDQGALFESFETWDDNTRKTHEDFFMKLLIQLHQFTRYLDKMNRFSNTAILITSDRRKAPTTAGINPSLEPVWEGGHISLISGSITGPVTLGDIYREHPKYSETYPMTWGASKDPYQPSDVHQLIMDLCLAESRFRQYNPEEENPWVAPRSLQGLFIKGHPGRVI